MRSWNTHEDLQLLDRFAAAVRESKLLEPGGPLPGDPVDLQGLAFPTVTQCEEFALPTAVVSRISGNRVFADATLKRVDLSEALLDFCVWNNCHFQQVSFDRAKLRNVRFFGCVLDGCSFRSTDLSDASFSVGRNGAETHIINTSFEKANFGGASCHNPVLKATQFVNCKLGKFVFDSPLCDGVTFVGKYKELTFRGTPGERGRNNLKVDLTKADVFWFDADHGLDLTWVKLPADASCMLITDRLRAVEVLAKALESEGGEAAKKVAKVLRYVFSDAGVSPDDPAQKMFLISRRMVEDFADEPGEKVVEQIFRRLRETAEQAGCLAKQK
jgi:uncharacterized protein YjbI with pentapeptide repeats